MPQVSDKEILAGLKPTRAYVSSYEVTGNGVRLGSTPSTSGAILGTPNKGDYVTVDMVGYKDGQEIIVATPHFVSTTGGGAHALDGVRNALTDEWHKLFPEYEGYVRGEPNSDHLSFDRKGIPSMMITQRYFDMETARKKDSDYENLSIPELKTTIDLICKYINNLDLTKIKY